MAAPGQGPDEYELARQRASQQANAAAQGQKDALKRRFAALGSINSGAAIKQEQMVDEGAQNQIQSANQQIDAAQRAEGRRVKEIEDARNFQREERLGSQEFTSGMAQKQMDFSRGEREASQKFSVGERLAGQKFAEEQSRLDRALRESQFGKQMDMANRQFEEDKRVNRENLDLARKSMDQKDMLERLLNPEGIEDLPFFGKALSKVPGGKWTQAAVGVGMGIPGVAISASKMF